MIKLSAEIQKKIDSLQAVISRTANSVRESQKQSARLTGPSASMRIAAQERTNTALLARNERDKIQVQEFQRQLQEALQIEKEQELKNTDVGIQQIIIPEAPSPVTPTSQPETNNNLRNLLLLGGALLII